MLIQHWFAGLSLQQTLAALTTNGVPISRMKGVEGLIARCVGSLRPASAAKWADGDPIPVAADRALGPAIPATERTQLALHWCLTRCLALKARRTP